MQEITVKKEEVVKINGKRFVVHPIMDGGCIVEEMTQDKENLICKKILDNLYAKEFKGLFFNSDEQDKFFQVYSQDLTKNKDKRYYVKYLRVINSPSDYGLDEEEGVEYYLYYDFKDTDICVFKVRNGKLIALIEDFKEKLIDGIQIK